MIGKETKEDKKINIRGGTILEIDRIDNIIVEIVAMLLLIGKEKSMILNIRVITSMNVLFPSLLLPHLSLRLDRVHIQDQKAGKKVMNTEIQEGKAEEGAVPEGIKNQEIDRGAETQDKERNSIITKERDNMINMRKKMIIHIKKMKETIDTKKDFNLKSISQVNFIIIIQNQIILESQILFRQIITRLTSSQKNTKEIRDLFKKLEKMKIENKIENNKLIVKIINSNLVQ